MNSQIPLKMQSNRSSGNCTDPDMKFQFSLYAATYIIIFIPGLLANSIALWILCRFISKKSKAIIFMINLAVADLAHVLSLPLRMFYYLNRTWPLGSFFCQLCFYLKYLNMYASICFLTCISMQRYLFLLHPFKAKDWKCRYDIAISVVIWIFVGAACLTVPIFRSPALSTSTSICFADLEVRQITTGATVTLVTIAELSGFVIPICIIAYCTWKMRESLQEFQTSLQPTSEKKRALRMILTCAAVFFICFTPYHINFPLFMMVKENVITNCSIRRSTLHFHPVSLCLASLNCCLDPILYYFMTSEFQDQLLRHRGAAHRSGLTDRESRSSLKETVDDDNTEKESPLCVKCWLLSRLLTNNTESPTTEPEEFYLQ